MNAKQYAEKRQELLNEMYAELDATSASAFSSIAEYEAECDKIAAQYGPRFDVLRIEYKQSKNRK